MLLVGESNSKKQHVCVSTFGDVSANGCRVTSWSYNYMYFNLTLTDYQNVVIVAELPLLYSSRIV
mgnify:FL=1